MLHLLKLPHCRLYIEGWQPRESDVAGSCPGWALPGRGLSGGSRGWSWGARPLWNQRGVLHALKYPVLGS